MPTPRSTEPSRPVVAGVRDAPGSRLREGRREDALDETGGPDALGCEWIVEARGCDPAALANVDVLKGLFRRIVDELALHEVRPSIWHVFPGPGGITGMSLLAESHLTCHTFPEHGTACLNLFCCRPRPQWDFRSGLREALDAGYVDVRRLRRRYAPAPDHST